MDTQTETRPVPDYMLGADWTPEYDSWRHGGWYVSNIRYPSGACGCVSRNYEDRKWRIVCSGSHDTTYATRNEAAHAERSYALSLYLTGDAR